MIHPVKMRFYRKVPNRYLNTLLSRFTHKYGELAPAVRSGKVVQVVIAKSKHNKLLGWAAVYKSIRDCAPINCRDYSVGIFVDERYRHCGIGGKLRRKAILWCLRQNKTVWWFRNGYIETLATRDSMRYIDDEIKPQQKPKLSIVPPKEEAAVTVVAVSDTPTIMPKPRRSLFQRWFGSLLQSI